MPTPEQVARFKRDDGARRFACNWAVEEIRQAFSSGAQTGQYDSAVDLYELRKRWNRVKPEVAPWWAECSKEAYSNGIADAVNALKNWPRPGGQPGRRQDGVPAVSQEGQRPRALHVHHGSAAG